MEAVSAGLKTSVLLEDIPCVSARMEEGIGESARVEIRLEPGVNNLRPRWSESS